MKKVSMLLAFVICSLALVAQEKKASVKNDLPDIMKSIRMVTDDLPLFKQNFADHSKETDVNSIINDIEKYLDSSAKAKKYADQLLIRNFNPLRHYYLTTTNKTSLATSFLFSSAPYRFCNYSDSGIVLHIFALKTGETYNLAKVTERKALRLAAENCLLPALKATDEFKQGDIRYIALSIYYGCKDTRDGAPAVPVVPYCLTMISSITDLQQFATGMITPKGLLASSELYLTSEEEPEPRNIRISID